MWGAARFTRSPILWFVLGLCGAAALTPLAQTPTLRTTPLTMGVVVAVCGTPNWTYATNDSQPITINVGGQVCVK